MTRTSTRILGIALLFGALATPAFAGGPNYLFEPHNPYVWHLDRWVGGAVPVYTDLGPFELLTNEQANGWTVAALDQWNNVPSSTYLAQVVGDVSLLGLSDITLANVDQVYPAFNGGGITVVYDHNGQIFGNYLGIPGVLGISLMELADPDTNELLENTTFLNGNLQWFNDFDGTGFSGVFTHELGHAANLRHTQANGAVQNGQTRDYPMPYGCTSGQPYSGGPGEGPNVQQNETMYPLLDQRTGERTSKYMFTVDRMDDIQAISDLYPAPGWPTSHGTVKGTVNFLTKILGNGSGPTEQITGVNLIARNIADPYNDFVSITTGEYTRGEGPADGSYELHGLTPGASYVVYTDNFLAGAFPTPKLMVLPGPEEWWNGALESGDGRTDDRCAWTGIPASAGSVATADITFNRVKGAPVVTIASFPGSVTDITGDGSLMVGVTGGSDDYWTWTGEGNPTFVTTGGAAHFGNIPSLSDDGTKIAAIAYDASNVAHWGIWENGAWTLAPPPPTTPPGGGPCTDNNGSRWGIVLDLSGDGSTIVGQANTRQCLGAGVRAAKWTVADGWTILAKDPATPTQSSRAQGVSYDGSVITGFDNLFGSGRGVYWSGGVEHFLDPTPQTQDPGGWFGAGQQITRDGQIIYGQNYYDTSCTSSLCASYLYHVSTGESEVLHVFPAGTSTAYRGSDDGSVVLGWDQTTVGRTATVWTRGLGWFNLQQFLNAQGTYFQGFDLGNATAISSDGRVWGGVAGQLGGTQPVRYDVPKAIVCHKSPGHPDATPENLDVTFPGGLDEHMVHGDTLGLCQIGTP